VPESKISLIHRGVDLQEFDKNKIHANEITDFKNQKYLPNNLPIILLPGRISRWKGHHIAIEAIAKLNNKEFILAIAGSAGKNQTYLKEIISLINQYGLENKIRFLDDVKNMPLAYAVSDFVLSTSIEPETFGRVSSEANAMGKPVIATALGGSKEIIKDNITGFLIQPNNISELANKIEYLLESLSDDKIKKDFSENCIANIVENFSLQKMCEGTLAIYKEFYKHL
jgi:glycosyltransferase involved in cell wall biosynthesis